MSDKTNLAFFKAYLELDKACADRVEISKKGISTYINKLSELKNAPERDEVLKLLIKYRKYRNKIAHEADAISEIDEITKDDIKWLESFSKMVEAKRDPISRYKQREAISGLWEKLRFGLVTFGIALVIVALVIIFSLIK